MAHLLLLLALIFFLAYAALIFYFRLGWIQAPEWILQKDHTPQTRVSIIIPARNEEQHIGHLLQQLQAQIYPPHLMEIIVVDDHSTDGTAGVVRSFPNVALLSLADFTGGVILNAYKKKAIETAIAHSSGELIITTDADCSMCEFWLSGIVHFFEQKRPHLIAAPVAFFYSRNALARFQSIDFCTMQGITAALSFFRSGTMCNGANLAYTRESFDAVGGFRGIDQLASGDDMFLMHKIDKRFPRRTAYLKCRDSIVYTHPVKSLKGFFSQRIRWASKADKFDDRRLTWILLLVFLFNLLLAVLGVLAFFNIFYTILFLSILVLKGSVELSFLIPVSRFFLKQKELWPFYLFQLPHIFYILFSALASRFGSYEWKGRRVN